MKKATNSATMRQRNEKMILSLINKKPCSRAEIAKKTGLTKAAVTIIVDDLMQKNIVTEEQGQSNSVGRTPLMLKIKKDAYFFVGVNITRRGIYTGITDLAGNVLTQDKTEICLPETAIPKIGECIQDNIKKLGISREKIYKIAVVTPGPVDSENGIILNPPNFDVWHNVKVKEELEKITPYEVLLQNVSFATALSEKYFGSAKDDEIFAALKVDEGIGSGIMIKDSLFKGPCEIGHTSVKYDGLKCECGSYGCLEKYASIPQILKDTVYKNWESVIDSQDTELIEKEAEYLACAITSVNNIFDFDKIVLCGELAYKPEKLVSCITEKIKNRALAGKDLNVCEGMVLSPYLIASSVAIHDFFI